MRRNLRDVARPLVLLALVCLAPRTAQAYRLGDFVWQDLNRDGVQDAGEPGIEGVTVRVYDQQGNLLQSTTTSDAGLYEFNLGDVDPGPVFVEFVAPAGYAFTARDQGGDDSRDSDADPHTGRTRPKEIPESSDDPGGFLDLTRDAGLFRQGAVIDIEKYTRGESPPVSNLADAYGKPKVLTMRYTANDNPTSHAQQEGKVVITGDNPTDDPVYIVAASKPDPTHPKAKIWFEGPVAKGATFDISAEYPERDETRLTGTTWAFIYDGVTGPLLQTVQFDTSGSQPLRLGDQYGSLRLVGFVGETGQGPSEPNGGGGGGYGEDADDPPGPEIPLGAIVVWTYVVTIPEGGTLPLAVTKVTDDNGTPDEPSDDFEPDPVLENGHNVGDTNNNGRLDPGEQWLFQATDIVETEGVYGNIATVVGKADETEDVSDSDPSHYHTPTAPTNLPDSYGKPQKLTMLYTAQGPEGSDHAQGPSKVKVVGDPDDAIDPVWIVAASKGNPDHPATKVWFEGEVAVGGTFVIDATAAGATRLSGDTHVFVYEDSSRTNLLQTVAFNTSGSQPLRLGDQFGSLVLTKYVGDSGTGAP